MPFEKIEKALERLRQGKMLILVDDEGRENEGDFVMLADKATPEAINFMTKHGRGLVCLSMTEEKTAQLELPMMVSDNRSRFGTAFTVSIEAREGVTTGISAQDRATTIQTAIKKECRPQDLVKPGHIFPLRARKGGVLVRAGHTEGIVDLARLAGSEPAGVLCEILKDDGSMAKLDDLEKLASQFDIPIIQIADLIRYRLQTESLVNCVTTAKMPTIYHPDFKLHVYRSEIDGSEHLALALGEIKPDEPTLVRVHSQCLTGEVFHSNRCDCGEQLDKALRMIAEAGSGVLLYLRQEGRGIGFTNKIQAYALQDKGADTVEANKMLGFQDDARDYGMGAQMLADLGVRQMRLLTNNPRKMIGLVAREGYGMRVVERVPVEVEPNRSNLKYLTTKKEKLGHLLNLVP